MNQLQMRDGVTLAWRLDDFTDPWARAGTVLFLHGNSESGRAWDRWVPAFARDFRLLRPDWRGFGQSQPMPEAHAWRLDELSLDLIELLDAAGVDAVHVVGAKIGGLLGLHFAGTHANRVKSLTVIGAPVRGAELTSGGTATEEIRRDGVAAWARRTMPARLGPALPPAAHAWWAGYMGAAPLSTQLGFMRDVPGFDALPVLGRIECPTLVIGTQEATPVGSADWTRSWQQKIRCSRLLLVPASSYHIAVTQADTLAPQVAAFVAEAQAGGSR